MESLESKLELIARCQLLVEKAETPSAQDLANIGVQAQTHLGLYYKILALRKQVEVSIREKRADIDSMEKTKASLTICPTCMGTGVVNVSKVYERLQEGAIIPISATSDCSICKGSGKLVLSQ